MHSMETDFADFTDRASTLEERAVALGAPVQQQMPLVPVTLPVSVDHVIALSLAFDKLGAREEYLQARELIADLLRLNQKRDPLEFANALGVLAAALAGAGRPDDAVAPLREEGRTSARWMAASASMGPDHPWRWSPGGRPGAASIDGMDRLRQGATGRMFTGARPSLRPEPWPS
ncbi:hypothetical protein AB0K74_27115 [Streptomyces sp. NPDC056159]|uniref:hypothetical protein n=1 Tax=Streptomyces sp. NPDC056159 TaxID=3155537 RepID=UPI0034244C9A